MVIGSPVCLSAEVQREAVQQQGVADAAKQELRSQVAVLMRDAEQHKQQEQVGCVCPQGCRSASARAA